MTSKLQEIYGHIWYYNINENLSNPFIGLETYRKLENETITFYVPHRLKAWATAGLHPSRSLVIALRKTLLSNILVAKPRERKFWGPTHLTEEQR